MLLWSAQVAKKKLSEDQIWQEDVLNVKTKEWRNIITFLILEGDEKTDLSAFGNCIKCLFQ